MNTATDLKKKLIELAPFTLTIKFNQGLKALSHLTKQLVELQQEVTSIEVEIMKSEYEKKLCEDLHLQHNLLVPIIKNLDESVGLFCFNITNFCSTGVFLNTNSLTTFSF